VKKLRSLKKAQRAERKEPQFYVPDKELHDLGSEWERFLFQKLIEAGLKVIPTGKGVDGSNFEGEGLSPPDFEVRDKRSTHIEVTGTRKLKDYRDLIIQTGKLRYVGQYPNALVFVFYRGRVNQWGTGARLFWIRGEDCLGYPPRHVEQDVDKERSQGTFIPKVKWTEGLDSLIGYLKRLGQVQLLLLTDSEQLRIVERAMKELEGETH